SSWGGRGWTSMSLGLLLAARTAAASERLLLAGRLGGDLLELEVLQRRERLAGRSLLRIAEGAAEGLQAILDAAKELTLPFRQLDARTLGLAASAAQRVERGSLGLRLPIRRLALQISPSADR